MLRFESNPSVPVQNKDHSGQEKCCHKQNPNVVVHYFFPHARRKTDSLSMMIHLALGLKYLVTNHVVDTAIYIKRFFLLKGIECVCVSVCVCMCVYACKRGRETGFVESACDEDIYLYYAFIALRKSIDTRLPLFFCPLAPLFSSRKEFLLLPSDLITH